MRTPPSLPPGKTAIILAALQFAVQKALRKMNGELDKGASVTCRIAVTEILSRVGHVTDITTLTASILHHVFDSSASIKQELDVHFGPKVRVLVQELAGNTHLSQTEQMQDLLDRVPFLSPRAKEIILAEKICQLQKISKDQPENWSPAQTRGYMTWLAQIVDGCRGANIYLEDYFDELYEEESRLIRGMKELR